MGKAGIADLRKRAEKARWLAGNTLDAPTRAALLEMAAEYEAAARALERGVPDKPE